MAANQAIRDLKEKIRLERLLVDDIKRFNGKLTRNSIRVYAVGSGAFNASAMEPELTEILNDHYERVAVPFSSQITDELPADIEATSAETLAIATALGLFFTGRASEQASIITATNQRDIVSSIGTAEMVAQEEAVEGRPQTRRDTAVLVGATLSRKLSGRVTGISTLETQASAEASKGTEAQILTGQNASVVAGSPRVANADKEWVTVGDEAVRPDHVAADSQDRDLNEPFSVGGQQLRWPGDTSLGASIGNVANCRCSSVVSREDVFAVRRRMNQAPSIDRTASEQLLTSLGES